MATAKSEVPGDQGPGTVVLLAMRSSTGAKLLGKQLRDRFRLRAVDDAEQAWECLIGQGGISLVICELELAIDRFALLERIRGAGDNRIAALPLLLLVGEKDTEERQELAFQKGATDFINLPFSSAELSTRVRLHTTLYREHLHASSLDTEQVTAVNLLKQLAQESLFISRVQQELSFSERHRSQMSLGKLRVDRLREIVSSFDKSTAISVVQEVAKTAQQTMRREDTLCYLGNGDFKLLFPATNGIGAIAGIKRVLSNVEQSRIKIGGQRVAITLSAAVFSCIADADVDLQKIDEQLDASLGIAVERGGNQVVSSTPFDEARAMSVDRALKLLAAGRGDDLSGDIDSLMLQLLPLLDFADECLRLDLEQVRADLRAKLESRVRISVSN